MIERVVSFALNKPLFLHQRDAHADFLAILREHSFYYILGSEL